MRKATTSPEANVRAATSHIAAASRSVGSHAREQCTDRVPEVAPEPVYADGRCAPGRVRDIADRGEQRRVDHRRPDSEQHGADGEAGEGSGHDHRCDAHRLYPHAGGDQPLASDAVRPSAREELRDAPGRRVDRGERADLRRLICAAAKTSGNSPHAIPSFRLLTRPAWLTLDEIAVEQRGAPEHLALVRPFAGASSPRSCDSCAACCLRLAHEEHGQAEAQRRRMRRRGRTAAGADRSAAAIHPVASALAATAT